MIQITINDQFCSVIGSLFNYGMYFKHIFAYAEVSDNCPNIENIIASPNMDNITMGYIYMFRRPIFLLHLFETEIYAKNIKISKGEPCKLRSLTLNHPWMCGQVHSYERILNLYSNLHYMAVNVGLGENFDKFLPQFIRNGLKYLYIINSINVRNAKKYCVIGKNLGILRFCVNVTNDDDVSALNKLQLPRNVELTIKVQNVVGFFAQLSESICASIVHCDVDEPIDCNLMSRLKNLPEICFEGLVRVCF